MRRGRARLVRCGVVGALLAAGVATSAGQEASGLRGEPGGPFEGRTDWVAYQTFRNGHEGTWLVHPDGTGDHEIATDIGAMAVLPDWSPDGERVVVSTRGTGDPEPLYEYDLATGTSTQLFDCSDPCFGDDTPAYSPDGRRVAFIRFLGPWNEETQTPSDCGLWMGNLRTRGVRQLTSNTQGCDAEQFPRWSPNGRRLTYHRELYRPDGTVRTAVYTIRANGTDERRITAPRVVAGAPDWSPDGRWILFGTHPLNVFQTGGKSELFLVRPDGSRQRQLTSMPAGLRATQPRFTPDGSWIVFTAVSPDRRALWAIPAAGGTPVVLADHEQLYTHGTWQPPGPTLG